MRSIRKSGVTALTAAIALSIGAIPVAFTAPALLAAGEAQTIAAASASTSPKLVLSTTPANKGSVTMYDSTGAQVGAAQALTATGCALQSSGSKLLNFTGLVKATAKPPGFLKGSIGVAEKTSGTSCGRVDSPSEKLTLALGSDVIGSLGGPMLATAATLDLDLKGAARVTATATLGDKSFTYLLQSGPSSDPNVEQCIAGSDSGPDAGANDNCDWTIQLPEGEYFNKLELTAVAGSFALSGGADYGTATAPAHVSTIQLFEDVDGVLACGAATIKRPASGTTPWVQVRRLDTNADPDEACSEIPYQLRNQPTEATFRKPLSSQTTAQFVADFVWSQPTSSETTTLNTTQVNFEQGNGDVNIGWCPDPIYSGTIEIEGVTVPQLTGIADPLGQVDLDGTLDKVQFACVGVQTATVEDPATTGDPETIKVIEQVYVLGDILMKKGY